MNESGPVSSPVYELCNWVVIQAVKSNKSCKPSIWRLDTRFVNCNINFPEMLETGLEMAPIGPTIM